ncbi:hypothetical protein [Mesorhizobium sp. CAU 1741]|uniref:hypothetical protein n=1 Tax=Mesorhizobium sp. CAU 1741 TaxID=3140366 RepID=UPI00325B3223
MSRLIVYLGRFTAIIIGFTAAALAAGLFASLLLFGAAGWMEIVPYPADGPFYLTTFFLTVLFAYHAFGPAFIAMLIAEFAGLRDWLYHALAGAAVAGVSIILAWENPRATLSDDAMPIMAALACGMVGGICYWAVAGRRAGAWLHGGDIRPAPP